LLFLLLFLGVPAGVTALCFMTMGPSPQAIVMPVWCLRPFAVVGLTPLNARCPDKEPL
jgi:hypothetical protein